MLSNFSSEYYKNFRTGHLHLLDIYISFILVLMQRQVDGSLMY